MKCIDFENHFFDQKLVDILAERKALGKIPYYDEEVRYMRWTEDCFHAYGPLMDMLLDFDDRIALMDKRGIDVAVLSSAHGFEYVEDKCVEVCKHINDLMYQVIQKYPGRFMGTACLPVFDVEEAVKELERCVKELGFVGWHTHSNYGKGNPTVSDEMFWPIWAKAEELGVYVYVHPSYPDMEHLNPLGASVIAAGLGFTVDTMIEIAKIISMGVFDQFPKMKMILGHYGEAIPFILERMENRFAYIPNEKLRNKELLGYYFQNNILVDTSGNTSIEAFQCTKDVLGMDRILVGTDYPFEIFDDTMDAIERLPLTEEEREMLYYKNAETQLGITF